MRVRWRVRRREKYRDSRRVGGGSKERRERRNNKGKR